MKCTWTVGLVVLMVAIGWSLPGRAQRQATDVPHVGVDALMQRKLTSSQALLKGLAMEDYELIQREAGRLQLLSMDVGWNILQTADYGRLSAEFRTAAKQISQAGEDENLDAAGLGYFKLTMTCIDCHRHVRSVKE